MLACCQQGGGHPQVLSPGICWGLIPGKPGGAVTDFSGDYPRSGFCASTELELLGFCCGKRIFQQVTALKEGARMGQLTSSLMPMGWEVTQGIAGGHRTVPAVVDRGLSLMREGLKGVGGCGQESKWTTACAACPQEKLAAPSSPQPTITQMWKEMLSAR